MPTLNAFARFGIHAFFIEKVDKEIFHPYFSAEKEAKASQRSGALVAALDEFLNDPRIDKCTEILLKQKLPESIEGVFYRAVRNVPASDITKLASLISQSKVFEKLAEYSPSYVADIFNEMSERCPQQERLVLLSVLDGSNHLLDKVPKGNGQTIVEFYKRIFSDVEDIRAISRLRASPSWNAMDHKSRHFVEWVDHVDTRLLAALNQQ